MKADRMRRFITDKNTTSEQSFVGSLAAEYSVCPIFRISYEFIRRVSFSTTAIAVQSLCNRCPSMSE